MNDEDDPFKELNKDLKELLEKDPCLVPENMTAEILVKADDVVITTSLPHTDEVMMEEVMMPDDEEPNDTHDEEFDEELTAPSTREVENSIEILKKFSLFSANRGGQMQDLVCKFETLMNRDRVEKSKQSSILNYFL